MEGKGHPQSWTKPQAIFRYVDFFLPPVPKSWGLQDESFGFFSLLDSWEFPGRPQGLGQPFTTCFGGRQLAGSHSGLSCLHHTLWLLILKWTNRSYSKSCLLPIYIFIFSTHYLEELLVQRVFIFSSFSISVQKLQLALHCYCCILLSGLFHHDLIEK